MVPFGFEAAGDVCIEIGIVGEEEEEGEGRFFFHLEFFAVHRGIGIGEGGGDEFPREGGSGDAGAGIHEAGGVVDDEDFLLIPCVSLAGFSEGAGAEVEVGEELFLPFAEALRGAAVLANESIGAICRFLEVEILEARFSEEAIHFGEGGPHIGELALLRGDFFFEVGKLGFQLREGVGEGIFNLLSLGGDLRIRWDEISEGGNQRGFHAAHAVFLQRHAVVDGFVVLGDVSVPLGEEVRQVAQVRSEGHQGDGLAGRLEFPLDAAEVFGNYISYHHEPGLVVLPAAIQGGRFGEGGNILHEALSGGLVALAEIGDLPFAFFVSGVEGLLHLAGEIFGERLLAVGAAAAGLGFDVVVAVAEPVGGGEGVHEGGEGRVLSAGERRGQDVLSRKLIETLGVVDGGCKGSFCVASPKAVRYKARRSSFESVDFA